MDYATTVDDRKSSRRTLSLIIFLLATLSLTSLSHHLQKSWLASEPRPGWSQPDGTSQSKATTIHMGGPTSPYSGRDSVKSLRSSYTGLHPQIRGSSAAGSCSFFCPRPPHNSSSGHFETGSVEQDRGGLVFKAHRPLYRSTLGSSVIKKKKQDLGRRKGPAFDPEGHPRKHQVGALHHELGHRRLVEGCGLRVEGWGLRVDR